MDVFGSPLFPSRDLLDHAVIIASVKFEAIAAMSFTIKISRPALVFNDIALIDLCSNGVEHAKDLKVYLLSRDYSNLKAEFMYSNRKVRVSCIKGRTPMDIVLAEHLYLNVVEYHHRKAS